MDLAQLNAYAQAVFAAAVEYTGAADLERMIDLSMIGAGEQNHAWCISNLMAGHLCSLSGEIAAVKGTFGLKGDAF